MAERFNVRVAVYGIFEEDGKILLQQRANTSYMNGYYSLPAGHLDPEESITMALIRELKEEIGVDVVPEDMTLDYTNYRQSDAPYIIFFFKIKKYSGKIVINEPDKCTDLRFFSYDELPENLVPELKVYFRDRENGKSFNDYGKFFY
ncbi:MAG: hypothetical protein Ta2D_09610 [Rickettsiales bacterium]|nr:MAG: hypothetical protein Ta2D_09610 [Rickettsiales bacterium]